MAVALEVRNNQPARRYEAEVEGQSVVLEYVRRGNRLTLTHTGVPSSLEGRGIGSALTRAVLEDARARGFEIVPECPFVSAYIRRHPEYLPLVEPESRESINRTG